MDEDGRSLFVWQRFLFVAHVVGSRLVLSWRGIESLDGRNSRGHKLDRSSSDISSSSDEDGSSTSRIRCLKDDCPETTTTTSFDLSGWTDCQLIAASSVCDPGLLRKQPVLLLKCVSVGSDPGNVEYLFLQVRETPPSLSGPGLVSADISQKNSGFSLALVQSYSFNTSHNLTCHKHLAVLPDLQLLIVHPDSMTVMLCGPDHVSSHDLQLKDCTSLTADWKSVSDVEIVDALCVADDRTVIALVGYKPVDGIAQCRCLQFSPNSCVTSHTHTEQSCSISQLPVDILFAAHYTQILRAASISSFTCTYSLSSKSSSFESSVTMLTQTGYALWFQTGVLKCCVNLTGYGDLVSDDWSRASVKVISFDGCPDRIAVQVNSTCHLVNWTTEKVVKSLQSVVVAQSCDVSLCGLPSLVLVLQPETGGSPGTTNSHQLLQETVVVVVDVEDVSADDSHGEGLLEAGTTWQASQLPAEDGQGSQSLCAASALLGQQRQCQQAVSEMETQLREKLSFLAATWQQLADNRSLSYRDTSPGQLPLTVLVEGCLPSPGGPGCRLEDRTYLQTGSLWQRLVDSLLVVGLTVTNVSLSQLSDVQIKLVPAAHSQTKMIEAMSKFRLQPPNLASVAADLSIRPGLQENSSQTEFNRPDLLPPGGWTVATCVVDISAAVSSHDLIFHTFVSYSVLGLEGPVRVSRQGEVSVRKVEESCAQVVITPSQLLADLLCLGGGRDLAAVTLTLTDLQALDCVQKHWTLLVETVVSSVTSLALKLSHNPRLVFLDWADQFLFVDSSALKYCRLQLLKPSSRWNSSIQIFARSQSQALLLVTFLYSVLPEDVTITHGTSHDMASVGRISRMVLGDVERKISAIKEHLTPAPPQATDVTSDMPAQGSLSPKFLSSRQQVRPQAVGPPGTQAPVTNSSRLTEGAQETGDVGTEKRRFRVARKRFRDIWADDGSP